jgi:hypothetical protein
VKKANLKNKKILRVLKKATVALISLSMAALVVAMPAMEASAASWQGSGITATAYQSGDGSVSNPFQIVTAGQLAFLAENVNGGTNYSGKYFILNNDISLAGNDWTPIGDSTSNYFGGTFNGADHQITALTIGTPSNPDTTLSISGLFGEVNGATIENVGVNAYIYSACTSAASISDNAAVGAIAGLSFNSTITNCNSSGTVSGGITSSGTSSGTNASDTSNSGVSYTIGGLVGVGASVSSDVNDSLCNITGCYSTATVAATDNSAVGGFVGENMSGTFENCYATGTVISGDSAVGGFTAVNGGNIIGCNATGSASGGISSAVGGLTAINGGGILNSYATGNVTSGDSSSSRSSSAGGLVSVNEGAVINCYSTGSVTGGVSSQVGGLVGDNETSISNCYSVGTVIGGSSSTVGGFVGYQGSSSTNLNKCYWAVDTASKGVGTGTDTSTQMALSDMQNETASPSFATTLNSNIDSLSITGGSPWVYASGQSSGLPTLTTVTKISVNKGPTKSLYGKNSTIDPSGAAVNVTYSNGAIAILPMQTFMISGFNSTTAGNKTVTVSYCGFTASFTVSVDVTPPVFGAVKYSIKTLTNKNVTVTVAVSGGTKPSLSHKYTANGSYTFTATDAAGNTVTKAVKVSNIDKAAPVIKANVGNNKKIHGKVSVTVTDANLNAKTVTLNGHTVSWGTGAFTKKGKYIVTATDKVGNKSSYTFTIY